MSDNAVASAVLAALNARLAMMATPREAFEMDDAPKVGGDYVAVTVSRRFLGTPRANTTLGLGGWRITTRAVGNGVTNARVLLDICSQALEAAQVTANGVISTPIAFESEDPIRQDDADDNLWSGLRSWTTTF